ncbi:MAG: hypothetical protein FWF57_07075 [Defluviitaleaceae bacterium]|nr:hypothetical protein [Defluviitaleaceae bacterium]
MNWLSVTKNITSLENLTNLERAMLHAFFNELERLENKKQISCSKSFDDIFRKRFTNIYKYAKMNYENNYINIEQNFIKASDFGKYLIKIVDIIKAEKSYHKKGITELEKIQELNYIHKQAEWVTIRDIIEM